MESPRCSPLRDLAALLFGGTDSVGPSVDRTDSDGRCEPNNVSIQTKKVL